MTSWIYLNQSVPWILAGLLVGFFMGRSTALIDSAVGAVQDEGEPMPEPKQDMRTRRPRFTVNAVLGAVIVALGIFTAVQSYVQGEANQRQSEATARLTACQTAYANGFADALDARSKATLEAQDAQDELWTSVASLTPTPEGRAAFWAALKTYLDKRAAAKKAQAENPFPEPPRDVCKEAG